jgi:hypothetical protein
VTALEYFENPKDAMTAVAQVLEHNGRVLILVTSRYALFFRNVGRPTPYSIDSFKYLLPNTGLEIEEIAKVGGIFSFLFQTMWFGVTFFIARGLRSIVYLFFLGKRESAKQQFPMLIQTLSHLRYLHLKTRFGWVLQRSLYGILSHLDRLLPFCTSAHLFVLQLGNSRDD